MRHRRAAERRQVDPVQRAHQGRDRGRELPFLHHRAERRHRRGAGPRGSRRWSRSPSRRRSFPRWSSSSISPAWSPARPRARASATSSSPTSARPTPSRTSCAVSRTRTSCTSPERSTPYPTSRPSTPSWRWPTCRPWKSSLRAARSWPRRGRQGGAAPGRGTGEGAGRAERGPPGPHGGALEGGAGAAAAAVPADDEADHVRRQRQRKRLSRQPAARRRSRRTPPRRARRWWRSAPPWRPRSRTCPRTDKKVFLADMGMEEPGLNRVIRAGYGLLGLQTYFTAGPKEVRAWTVPVGATAPQAAGVIHTDFERGFIRAEVVAYADFVACKGEQGAKEAGKLRIEGKEYVVKDGDVMHFRFNV